MSTKVTGTRDSDGDSQKALDWKLIMQLTQELSGKGVSPNLLRQAIQYHRQYPSASALVNWLGRFSRLGNTFASGQNEIDSRKQMAQILDRYVRQKPRADWQTILSWSARLLFYNSSRSSSTSTRRQQQIRR